MITAFSARNMHDRLYQLIQTHDPSDLVREVDSNNHRDHGTGKKWSVHGVFMFGRQVQQRKQHTRVEKGA